MTFQQIKIYRTRNKSNPLFFSENFKKKLILILSENELNNDLYVDNLNKTSAALGLDIEEDVYMCGIPDQYLFNWSGILELKDPLILVFFGADVSGLEELSLNKDFKLGSHTILQTYSMNEIVNETDKKSKFWLSFKSLFGR